MQEHTNTKEQDTVRARSNPIHVVPSRQGTNHAEALREVHMSLVRAEQNLYNLVQANHANGQAPYGFGPAAGFSAAGYSAPAYPPGFAPGSPIAPASFGLANQPNGITGAGFAATPSAFAPAFAYGQPAIGFGQAPSIAPWNPIAAMTALPGAIAAGVSALSNAVATGLALLPSLGAPASTSAYATPAWIQSRTPACDIADEGKAFVCHVDLPGLRADQVELLCLEQAVIVSGFREAEGETVSLVQSERGVATQQRTIVLPAPIQPGNTKAALSNGILTITLPKVTPTEGPRRVKVQG